MEMAITIITMAEFILVLPLMIEGLIIDFGNINRRRLPLGIALLTCALMLSPSLIADATVAITAPAASCEITGS